MPRRVGFMMFLGFVATFILTTGISAGADPADIQEQEVEVADAQDRLEEVRAEAGAAYESYNNALSELNKLDEEVAGTKEDLEAAEVRLSEAQAQLEQRAAQVYRSENVAFLDVLVNAEDFSEFAARLDLWLALLGQEREEFEAVLEARNELQAEQDALQQQRTQRADAVEEAAARKRQAENAEAQAQALLDSLNGELRAMIEAEEARRAEAARAAAQAAVEEAAAAQTVELASEPVDVAQAEPPTPPADPQAELLAQEAAQQRAAAEKRAEERREAAEAAQAAAEEAEQQAKLAEERAEAREQAAEERKAEREAAEEARREAEERREAAEEARREAELAAVERAAAERAAQQERAAELAAQREAERLAQQRAAERAEEQAAELAAQQRAEQLARQRAAERLEQERLEQLEQERLARQRAAEQPEQEPVAQEPVAADPTAAGQTTAPRPSSGGSSGGGSGGASGSAVVAEAETWLGVPYKYGGTSRSGVDCSGLTMMVYAEFGISLPRTAAEQYGYGTPVSSPAPGDMVFFGSGGNITSVGIVTGPDQAIKATVPGDVVRYVSISEVGNAVGGVAGYRRVL